MKRHLPNLPPGTEYTPLEITVRDRFACAALQGLAVAQCLVGTTIYTDEELAQKAFNVADHMMAARRRRSQ